MKILVIEDERNIAEGLKLNFELMGHTPTIAKDGIEALKLWKQIVPDLIVLDLMLPKLDGFQVLTRIRETDEAVPIIVLSARYNPDDKVRCFQEGVDDYLCKPFNLDEFLLRVERLIKRSEWSKKEKLLSTNDVYTFGDNLIDFNKNIAKNKSDEFSLTVQEVKLLKLFIENEGRVLSRQELLFAALGYQNEVFTRTIDNFIVRFRKYFEADHKSPLHFKSIRAVGYIFYS